MKEPLKIAIAGATGYVGLELIKILSKHPKVKVLYLCANKSVGKNIYTFDKKITKKNLPIISKIKDINWSKYENKKVMIKGCTSSPVPTWAYLIITAQLVKYSDQVLYGEPCSAVKIYKK